MDRTKRNLGVMTWSSLVLAAGLLTGPPAAASPEHPAHGKAETARDDQLLFQLQGSGGRGG